MTPNTTQTVQITAGNHEIQADFIENELIESANESQEGGAK